MQAILCNGKVYYLVFGLRQVTKLEMLLVGVLINNPSLLVQLTFSPAKTRKKRYLNEHLHFNLHFKNNIKRSNFNLWMYIVESFNAYKMKKIRP